MDQLLSPLYGTHSEAQALPEWCFEALRDLADEVFRTLELEWADVFEATLWEDLDDLMDAAEEVTLQLIQLN